MNSGDLHRAGDPLIPTNAWDAASAAALLAAGFPTIGTTSLGPVAGHGLAAAARAIPNLTCRLAYLLSLLPCLVSIDIDDGFAEDPAAVAEYPVGCRRRQYRGLYPGTADPASGTHRQDHRDRRKPSPSTGS